jgi:hypothetical protein
MTTVIRTGMLPLALFAALGFGAVTVSAQQNSNTSETGIGLNCDDPNSDKPNVALDADSVAVLSGTKVKLTASGKGSKGEPLEYMWRADRGRIFGKGSAVEFDTAGLAPGKYDVLVMGRGGKCNPMTVVKTIEVIGCPPDLRLVANNVRVNAGEVVSISASGLPSGFGLRWSASEGRVSGDGGAIRVDTAGVAADTITVSATSFDVPECSREITIAVIKPPVILPDILNFPMTGGRLNNANKAVLDDVTLRGERDIQARIIVTGKSMPNERPGLAKIRAENARNYLVSEKGVDASRVEIRTQEGTAAEGGIEIAILPPGARMP